MTPENFCYWLQGFIEISNPSAISSKELQEIRNHLKLTLSIKHPPETTVTPTEHVHIVDTMKRNPDGSYAWSNPTGAPERVRGMGRPYVDNEFNMSPNKETVSPDTIIRSSPKEEDKDKSVKKPEKI